MITKQQMLNEIIRTAKDNGGTPLGQDRLERETGIQPYEWHRYWSRYNDALEEAGFSHNKMNSSYNFDHLIEKLIELIRELNKFPTSPEMVLKRYNDAGFPAQITYRRLGSKDVLVRKVIEYCKSKTGYDDVIAICEALVDSSTNLVHIDDEGIASNIGSVYLFKSGRYYKIGKTNDTVRRGSELRIQLPDDLLLIHEIQTDDPSGIESYWHKRFESKRKNGEWFDLSSADVKAFKCWKRII